MMSEHTNRIRVCVRVRPALPREAKDEVVVSVPNKNTIVVRDVDYSSSTPITHSFSFDRCYSSTSSSLQCPTDANQSTLMNELGCDLVANALDGYNDTLFAYGQTGAGKTYSVVGGTGEDMGLLPRIIERLFEQLLENELRDKTTFCCEVSYVEIYNEQINDLLVPSVMARSREPLQILHHPKYGMFIPGLTECNVRSEEEVMEVMETGLKMRSIGATSMNNKSSRSHCIFMLSIVQNLADNSTLRAKVNLVDLAGSERHKSVHSGGMRFKEGAMINTTLSTLALVIQTLAIQAKSRDKKDKHDFVPFRNSKLTYLLQESLVGNSKTVMIAAVSPVQQSARETIGTLRFASSVKKIKTKAVKNEKSNTTIVGELSSEIKHLKAALENSGADQDEKLRLSVSRRKSELLSQTFSQSMKKNLRTIRRTFSNFATVVESAPRLRNISHDWFLTGKLEYSIGNDDNDSNQIVIGSCDACNIQLRGVGILPLMAMVRTIKDEDDEDYKVYITRFNENGRVLVNGRLIATDAEITLSHGDRIIFGHAFACMLVLPGMETMNTDFDIDKVMSEVETESLPEFRANCKRFIDDVVTRFGEEKGQGFVCEVKKALPMIVEANDISDVVHKDNTIRFSIASGSDLFDETPLLLIRSRHIDGGRDIFWTMSQFQERLTYMREAYDASLEGAYANDTLVDPWLDPSYSQLLELAAHHDHEVEQLRMYAKQNILDNGAVREMEDPDASSPTHAQLANGAVREMEDLVASSPIHAQYDNGAVREMEDPVGSSPTHAQHDEQILGAWKEKCFQAVLESKKLNEAVLEEKKLGNDWKNKFTQAELEKFNADRAVMTEKTTTQYWKERCALAEDEMNAAFDRLLTERKQWDEQRQRPGGLMPEPAAPATGLTTVPTLLKSLPPLPNILEEVRAFNVTLPNQHTMSRDKVYQFTASGGCAGVEQQKQGKGIGYKWANAIASPITGIPVTPTTIPGDGCALLPQSAAASPAPLNFPGFGIQSPPASSPLFFRADAPSPLMFPQHVSASSTAARRDATQTSPSTGQWSARGRFTLGRGKPPSSHTEGVDRLDHAVGKLRKTFSDEQHGVLNELVDIIGQIKKDNWARSSGVVDTYKQDLGVVTHPQTKTVASVDGQPTDPRLFTIAPENAKASTRTPTTPAPATVTTANDRPTLLSHTARLWNAVPSSIHVHPPTTWMQSPSSTPMTPYAPLLSSGACGWFSPPFLRTNNDVKKATEMTTPTTSAAPPKKASPEGAASSSPKSARKKVHFEEPLAPWVPQPSLLRTVPRNADTVALDSPQASLSARQLPTDKDSINASQGSGRPLARIASAPQIGWRARMITPIKMDTARFAPLRKIRLSPKNIFDRTLINPPVQLGDATKKDAVDVLL